jgi:pimeloyl-ACP methyl ester carboxylesterase
MTKRWIALALACCLASPLLAAPSLAEAPAAVAETAWTVTTEEHPVTEGSAVLETVWTAPRAPGGQFDRIGLHRYRTAGKPIATLLYLPGTNMNGVSALTDEAHNIWLYLAARGIEVYAMDYRTHAIPAETPVEALGDLKGWTTAAFVNDVAAAADFARSTSGVEKLYVSGFSRGVFLAYAYASSNAEKVSGLILFDGPFKNHSATNAFDRPAALAKLEAAGVWASDIGGSRGFESRQQLMDVAAANPDAPATDPKFKTIGEQLAYVLQNAWLPGGLANPMGGVSKPQVLAKLLGGYDRYYPTIQDIDGAQMSAFTDDPSTPIDDKWGELDMPILMFAGTGMGGDWLLNAIYSAAKSGSKDVTFSVLERYGHLDVLVAETAQRDVYTPTLEWLRARAAATP